MEFATLTWVDWFNHPRLMEPTGCIPPAEAEERYYAMLDEPAMAAKLKPNDLRETRGGSEMLSTSALPLMTAASASGVGGSVPTS